MKYTKNFFALSLALLVFAPASFAQGNDYAPSNGPVTNPPPAAPPPSLESIPGAIQSQAGPQGGQGFGAMRRKNGGGGGGNGAGKQRMMAKFDTNGDGQLDDNERAQLQAWRAQRGLGKQGGAGAGGFSGGPGGSAPGFSGGPSGQGNGPGGPGRPRFGGAGGAGGPGVGGADREARRAKMMQRFDTNGDGSLDATEQAAADQFRQQRKAQRMQRMQQGGGGGGGGFGPPGGGPGGPDGPNGGPGGFGGPGGPNGPNGN